jgi:hypothetical protein
MSVESCLPVQAARSADAANRVLLVVTTCGRQPGLLKETLGSVLGQRDEPADDVLVAPREALATRELAAGLGVTVLDDPGRGPAAAVNAGFSLAMPNHLYGNWIGEQDLLLPGAVAVAAARLDARPTAVLTYGDCRLLTAEGHYFCTPHLGWSTGWSMTWRSTRWAQPAALFRLAAIAEAGWLDESLRYAADLDLLLRLRRLGRFEPSRRTLAVSRPDPEPATADHRAKAAREDEDVRRRHLPVWLRSSAPIWELPLRLLTSRWSAGVRGSEGC